MTNELTKDEADVLELLGEVDECQYGECYGVALDGLVARGLAEVLGEESGWNNRFIAKGDTLMYRIVRLTEAGLQRLNDHGSHYA